MTKIRRVLTNGSLIALLIALGCSGESGSPASNESAKPAEQPAAPETNAEEAGNTEDESASTPVEPSPETPAETGEPAAPEAKPVEEASASATPDSKPMARVKGADDDSPLPPAPEPEPTKPLDDGYVNLPENYEGRMGRFYTMIREDLVEGSEDGLPVLIQVSAAISGELAASDKELSRVFMRQAGSIMEAVEKESPEKISPAMKSTLLYNIACADALDGNLEEAGKKLEQAVASGFNRFEHMREDEDLASLFKEQKWLDKLGQWELEAIERLKELAKADLAAGERFDFDFQLETYNGKPVALSDYRGKVVIADIWGTWCPPCRAEIPSFIKLQNKYADQGFQMVGLNYERSDEEDEEARLTDEREKIANYVAEAGINYPCVVGDDATKEQVPGFRGFPTTIFIDRGGNVRMTAVGLHEYAYLDAIVSELLSEKPVLLETPSEPETSESPAATEKPSPPPIPVPQAVRDESTSE